MSKFLTILTFGTRDVPNIDGFRKYVEEVSSNFCPYIEPSMTKNSTTYTVVRSDTEDKETAEKIIFASGYSLCELLRSKRARSASERRVPLLCENALFLFPHIDDAFGKELLGWPHWVLKCRYTQLGILFGKFWKNAHETSKDGRDLPVPPCHFISVRESVQAKDPQFFEHAEWLRPALESSNDIGQNVFNDMADCQDVTDVIGAFCAGPTQLNFERVNITMVQSNFYAQTKELAARELEAHKRCNVN